MPKAISVLPFRGNDQHRQRLDRGDDQAGHQRAQEIAHAAQDGDRESLDGEGEADGGIDAEQRRDEAAGQAGQARRPADGQGEDQAERMPTDCAAAGFCATARIAMPWRWKRRKRKSAARLEAATDEDQQPLVADK